ncbi:MAG: UDP-N-acetylglucosamine 2-epimerase [Thiomonas arsenitoxydans]|uniref:UDP-N-acetylglucosamine 2-epimerase n=1 Tax=Thiomonas arsenitoxydans (strain DSM 22701 / CIP 110005 / 3As) TaxID=426114 RepID=A0A8I1SWG1_THIA3|nr:UDP-N-acetylglucosamine 2-epimerase [Thiomonas arsenitoxydans]MBN8745357.1 UDP-N-acetylglucosamine 2-epimerase [Thiomonas arsenitoxydans]
MPRRILYLSGTRADFGLMRQTLHVAAAHPGLEVAVAVTGMHLHPDYGHTVDDIEASGLRIAARIPSDVGARDGAGMARAISQTLAGLAPVLLAERPDALLLLGDRGEMLAGAIAALHLGVPSIHLHGGERSGTVDEPVRHAISKLAALHFCATVQSRERLIAMGENPQRVHVVGAPGLDDLSDARQLPREAALHALQTALERQTPHPNPPHAWGGGTDVAVRGFAPPPLVGEAGGGIRREREALFSPPPLVGEAGRGSLTERPYALVLFHPVVQEADDAAAQTQALLDGLRAAGAGSAFSVVWLAPNADAGSGHIEALLRAQQWPGFHRITHLPRADYLAALRHAAVLAGNSSSGIIEAASLGTRVVNVGSRQNLRERNANTVDVPPQASAIEAAVRQALALGPWSHPQDNVYGDGRSAVRIVHLLATLPLSGDLLHKVNRY